MKESWGQRVFVRLTQVSPFAAAIVAMTAGVLLWLLSFPAGLSAFTCPSEKLAGFSYELNWGVNFMFVLPAAFYLTGLTITGIENTVRNLALARMIVDRSGAPCDPEQAVASWHELGGRVVPICVALALAGIGQGLGEWYLHSYLPISRGSVTFLQPEYACSWSVAAALHPSHVNAAVNHLFSFAAFLGQGIATSFYLSLVAIVLAFAYWTDRFGRRRDLPDLVPALDSTDRRRGFELIEPFVQNLFAAGLSFTVSLFLVRLQFLFLGSTNGSFSSVFGFIIDDVAAGFFHGIKRLFAGDMGLFYAGPRLVWSTAGAIAGFLVLLVVSCIIVSTVLRQAAVRGRDVFVARRAQLAALYPELTPAETDDRLRGMVFWPLSYPNPLHMLFIMSFAVCAFVAYKMTLIVLGFTIALGARLVYRILKGDEKATSTPLPPRTEGQSAGQ